MQLLTERYNKKIQGVIACYDRLIENGFVFIEDYTAAQKLANGFRVETIHRLLDSYAKLYCPVYAQFNLSYHWSIMQVEYATDIVFKKQSNLEAIYDNLVQKTSGQVSRILKRLHLHACLCVARRQGLIKKVRDTYKYYPTRLGRRVIATGIKLKELYIIPQLCY
jgi:hypothetical protein